MKLHLGCGNQRWDGYINIDVRETPATDLIADITNLDYPENSIEEIQAHHVLEHIEWEKVHWTLKNWYRILKPDCYLVLSVPDIKESFFRFLHDLDWVRLMKTIYGYPKRNSAYAHKSGFDLTTLLLALQRAGFKEFQRIPGMISHWEDFDICLRAKK